MMSRPLHGHWPPHVKSNLLAAVTTEETIEGVDPFKAPDLFADAVGLVADLAPIRALRRCAARCRRRQVQRGAYAACASRQDRDRAMPRDRKPLCEASRSQLHEHGSE